MNTPLGDQNADPALGLALAQDLDRLAEGLMALPEVDAVLLLGSAARGELAMMRLHDRPIYFGDFELMLISQRRLPAHRRRQARDFCARYEASLNQPSPRFHIDLAFRERRRLAQLPPIVFSHELYACGRVLRGPAVLAGLPQLRASQLDLANTREILFKRLWALAEGWPTGPDPTTPSIADRSLGALLWRQALDLTTVLLPAVGILEPGYARRVDIWRRHPELPFRTLIDGALALDSGDWLAECLRRRLACEAAEDPALEHLRLLAGLAAGLAWCLRSMGLGLDGPGRGAAERPPGDPLTSEEASWSRPFDNFEDLEISEVFVDLTWIAALAESMPAYSGRLFNERPITRGEWLSLAQQALSLSRSHGPRAAWRWLKAPRKGHLSAGLLRLHMALAEELAGRPEAAGRHLERAGWHARLSAPDAFSGAIAEASPVDAVSGDAASSDAASSNAASSDALNFVGDAPAEAEPTGALVYPSRAWLQTRDAIGRAFWRNIRLGAPGTEPKSGL